MMNFPSILECINDLNKEQIDGLLTLSGKFKNRESLTTNFFQSPPVIATSFLENSTRTKHSFSVAISNLGGVHLDFDADKSSLKKGENLEETLLTLRCHGVSACIIRSSESHFLNKMKEHPPIRVINGGDGINQHPTQALLDLFTMIELEGKIEGKTVAIIGDCKHSRVTHSLVDLLPQYGAKVIIGGPKEFSQDYAKKSGLEYVESSKECLEKADILYMLRIQLERHEDSNTSMLENYNKNYGISLNLMNEINKHVSVYHPGPCNIGVELTHDILRSKYYKGYEQVKNSIFMRMAIVQSILLNGDKNVGKLADIASI